MKALGIPGCSRSVEQMLWEIQGRHMLGTQDHWGQAESFLCSGTALCQFSSPDEEMKVNLHLERGPLPCDLSMSLLSTALAFSV